MKKKEKRFTGVWPRSGKKEVRGQKSNLSESESAGGLNYLVQNSNDVFTVITPQREIKFISSAALYMFGVDAKEMLGKDLFEYCCMEEKKIIKEMINIVLEDPTKTTEKNIVKKLDSGEVIYFEIRIFNYLDEPYVDGLIVNFRNITRRKELEKTIDHMSSHDRVTGLPNRMFFHEKLEEATRKNENTFALIIVDIDDFKYINNTLGYLAGDQLIVDVGERIGNLIEKDGCICRYLGDQFAILLENSEDIIEYEKLADKIVDIFREPFVVDKYEVYLTVSLGISLFPDDGEDGNTLEKSANMALFYAKSEGKNMYKFFSAGGDISSFKHFELRNDLYKAIEKKEMEIYFQPIVNIKTGAILAAEAFLRWEHPVWGTVNAKEFIGLAEETGLIVDFGKWVLRQVCSQYRDWQKKGLSRIKLSINYSSIQLFEKGFIGKIKEIIKEFGLNPNFLIIEVTEETLLLGDAATLENIKTLQDIGIQIAIDDFGINVASLSQLDSLNIDILKLSPSFIRHIPQSLEGTKILRALVNLVLDLDLKLVVKGIEKWEQLLYLRSLNCHTGQGYIFSEALPGRQFERILARKTIKPVRPSYSSDKEFVEKRRFFRVKFHNLLEGSMSIVELAGKAVNAGQTMILIKNIGPGGLCFVSNIKLPIKRDLILKFSTELLGQTIEVKGRLVWTGEVGEDLSEYGVEFIVDENERTELIRILNLVQIKMKNNIMFNEGSFISDTMYKYFQELKS